jgi:hypothetical protein
MGQLFQQHSNYVTLTPGSNGINTSRLSHIAELDLTDNLLSEWKEVLKLLAIFRSLKFLNLVSISRIPNFGQKVFGQILVTEQREKLHPKFTDIAPNFGQNSWEAIKARILSSILAQFASVVHKLRPKRIHRIVSSPTTCCRTGSASVPRSCPSSVRCRSGSWS